jgi:hypothetical protein
MSDKERQAGASWLEKKLSALDAIYHRFGRDGLKDHSLADVGLLLSSKELKLSSTDALLKGRLGGSMGSC